MSLMLPTYTFNEPFFSPFWMLPVGGWLACRTAQYSLVTYQVAILQSHKLFGTHIFMYGVVIRNNTLAVCRNLSG